MSQCVADDRDISKMFPASVYRTPKFPEKSVTESPKAKRSIRLRRKSTAEAKTVHELRNRLDTTIFRLLVTAQSSSQFQDLRHELFIEFVELSEAIATIWRVMNQSRDEVAIANAAFSDLKQMLLSDNHLLSRHDGSREEAIFCVDSLHRAHFLAQDVLESFRQGVLPPSSMKDYQSAISSEWWSLLHLHCLVFAIQRRITPTDAVFFSLLEGLRHSVMAYSFAASAMQPSREADYSQIDFATIGKEADREYATS